MTPYMQAYDDAFKIIQNAMLNSQSMIGVSVLTRVELYLLSRGRQELALAMDNGGMIP